MSQIVLGNLRMALCRDPPRGLDWTRCSDIRLEVVCPWVVRNQSTFFVKNERNKNFRGKRNEKFG